MTMTAAEEFQTKRSRLFAIAYRMLGSASDAEDVVQDAWLRYRAARPDDVRSPDAYLATIVTRLCLDRLKSAHATREQYIGPWLPEPIATGPAHEPDQLMQRSESITFAFLVLLETLSPEERAVFLLKDVFDYDHAEVAEILHTTVANSRQLLHRARARVAERRPRFVDDASDRRRVAERFTKALQKGDTGELTQLLAADVTFVGDGGGKAAASRHPLAGRETVVHFLAGVQRAVVTTGAAETLRVELHEVNGEPALVAWISGRLDAVFVLEIVGGAIVAIRAARNPDKLAYLARQLG